MAVVKWPGLQQYDAEMKQYIATHYEPKLQFDLTPVYEVTLAEDTEATVDVPYMITASDLGGQYQKLWLICTCPVASTSSTIQAKVSYSDGNTKIGMATNGITTANRISIFDIKNDSGMAVINVASGFSSAASITSFVGSLSIPRTPTPIFIGNSTITSIALTSRVSGVSFPSGTTITIYVAKEV